MDSNMILDLVRSCIRLTTPILLAALGATLCNRAGILNFALEGKMLLGAFLGITSAYWLSSSPLGMIVAMLSGALLGALFAFLYIRFKVDLVVLAIALNMLISEMTIFFLRLFFGNVGTWSDPSIQQLPDIQIPIIHNIPVLGPILSGHNIIVYLSWLATILIYVLLFHTKFGRHLRAVGENPAAAETVGINVARVQLIALMITGALAALGGAFLSIGHLTMFTRNISNNRGWVGFSASLFGMSNPAGVFFASLLFGSADAIATRIQTVTDIPPTLIQFFPNVLTIVALVLVGLRIRGKEALARRLFRLRMQKQIHEEKSQGEKTTL